MTKHYIEYLFPGIICPGTSVEEVKNRKDKPKPPEGTYAFRYFDLEVIKVKGETLSGQRKNESGLFYVGGTVKTYEQIKNEMPDSILERNMKYNKIKRVVITQFGQSMELRANDCVI